MKLNLFKEKGYENIVQVLFRIIVLSVAVFYFMSISVLPEENDEYYEVNLVKKYDFEISKDDILYQGNFELIKAGNVTEPIELPTRVSVPVNEKVSIRSFLPDDYDSNYLVVRASQENMTIFIGGMARVIYNTESSRPFGSQTTSRYVFCRTTAEDAGKELRITVSSPAQDYSCTLNEVYTGDRFIIWKYVFQQSQTNLILGFIGLGIGVFIIIIGISISVLMGVKSGLENAGWCIFFVGMWIICESKIRQLLTPNASSMSNLCFVVIMLGAIPMLLYINNLQRERYKVIYRALLTVSLINVAAQFVLQFFNVFDFLDMMFVSHLILFTSVIVAIILTAVDARKGYIKEYKNMVIGLVVLLVCLFIEVGSVYFITMASGICMIFGIVVFTLFSLFDTITRYREHERAKHEDRLRAQKEQSDLMTMQMIKTLSDTLEAKDEYTRGHAHRVADYSVLIAKKLGLDEKEISKLHYAASLHDMGKIGVPDTILNKPSKLTNEEYDIVKTHTVIGADIINGIELIAYTEDVARYHHERYDGKGYPSGLCGEEIPFYARIVAVADAYDAMNSKRIYRKAMSQEEIRNEIEKNIGHQFDPIIAKAFLELLNSGDIELYTESTEEIRPPEDMEFENVSEAGQMISAVVNTIRTNAEGGSIDLLTGLMLRNKGESVIGKKMFESTGALIFFDVDNLKTVNDLYGHKVGDVSLKSLGELLNEMPDSVTAFRAGGDEFVAFYEGATKEDAVRLVKKTIADYARKHAGDVMLTQTSLSIGIYITEPEDTLTDAMNRADKALYHVKKSGKDGYALYDETEKKNSVNISQVDLDNLISSIKTSGKYTGSLNMEYREFTKIYEYIVKLCKRYEHTCDLALITLDTGADSISTDDIEKAMECMGIAIKENIRNVDICTRYSSVQYLVILLEVGEENIDMVMQRVFARYYKICDNNKCIPSFKIGNMRETE